MAHYHCTSPNGLNDLDCLLLELEKKEPDRKLIKNLTLKYRIPYKADIAEQLDELLMYLNGISIENETEILTDVRK